jgi:hypothetical protein
MAQLLVPDMPTLLLNSTYLPINSLPLSVWHDNSAGELKRRTVASDGRMHRLRELIYKIDRLACIWQTFTITKNPCLRNITLQPTRWHIIFTVEKSQYHLLKDVIHQIWTVMECNSSTADSWASFIATWVLIKHHIHILSFLCYYYSSNTCTQFLWRQPVKHTQNLQVQLLIYMPQNENIL